MSLFRKLMVCITILCFVSISVFAASEKLKGDEETKSGEILKAGKYKEVNIETSHPYSAGVKDNHSVWVKEFHEPGASFISVHFKRFDLAYGDYVIIRDPQSNQKYKFKNQGVKNAGTFWATHIKGDTAVIELHSLTDNPAYGFKIDKYSYGMTDSGTDDNSDFEKTGVAQKKENGPQEPLKVGKYESLTLETPHPYPTGSDEKPVVWRNKIQYDDATYISVHFSQFQLAEGDCVVIRDPKSIQEYKFTGKGVMNAGTFWGTHINGDTAVIELYNSDESTGYGFSTDKFARGTVQIGGDFEAQCGSDDKKNAICYKSSHPDYYDEARALARLLINGRSYCTGQLISCDNHFITNEHCISTSNDASNTDYEFMSEADNCSDSNCQGCFPGNVITGADFIQDSADLDYGLVQFTSTNPQSTYGYMQIDDRTAVLDEEIFIPQHPGGRAKEFGIESSHSSDPNGNCEVYSITESACTGASGYDDVGYYCDTEGGSSGSAVLAASNLRMIALHHCADCPNRGVPITEIMNEIGTVLPSCSTQNKHIKYDSHTLIDDNCSSGGTGDADGIWDAGETIQFSITLHNDGTETLTSISATISTTTSGISITDDTATYADVAGGNKVTSDSPHYTIDIADTVACGTTIDFQIDISTAEGSWTDTFSQVVGDPQSGTVTLYSDDFESDYGWSFAGSGEWEIGSPNGLGGEHGNPDPGSAYAGSGVLGNDLSGLGSYPGDYETDLSTTTATSPAIDCSGASNVQLSFQRWLNVETPTYDGGSLLVSNDGSNWTKIWSNSATIEDSSWSLQTFDISATADNQSTVYIRFQIDKSDGSWQYSGWNVDELAVTGDTQTSCNMNTCGSSSGCGAPTASFSDDDPVCDGTTVNFSDGSTADGTCTISDWAWDFQNDGTTDSTAQNPSWIYAASGTYSAKLTVTQDDGQTDSVRNSVTVYANPTASFTHNGPVCDGTAVNFTDGTSGGTTPYSYAWDFDNDGTAENTVDANPSYTYASAGTYTAELTVTDANSCTDTVTSSVTVDACNVGEVDDGDDTGTEPADASKDETDGEVVITHNGATDADYYNLYRGTIGSLQSAAYDHTTRANTETCDGDSGDTVLEDPSLNDGNNYYYIVVGNNGLCAGSYGDDSNNNERDSAKALGSSEYCHALCN